MAYLQVLLDHGEEIKVAVPPTSMDGAEEGEAAALLPSLGTLRGRIEAIFADGFFAAPSDPLRFVPAARIREIRIEDKRQDV